MKLQDLITKLFKKRPAPQRKPQQTTLRATARAAQMEDYDDEEPTTQLASAFIVVIILHLVAIGGIYLFNSIKAHRRSQEPAVAAAPKADAKLSAKQAAPAAASEKTAAQPQPRAAAEPPVKTVPQQAVTLPSGTKIHRVQPGENLTKIATIYAVTVSDLEEANKLSSTAMLKQGQVLTIPTSRPVAKSATPEAKKTEPVEKAAAGSAKTYVVKKGETATSIAKSLGVGVTDLLKTNNISDPTKLRLGQSLKVPARNK